MSSCTITADCAEGYCVEGTCILPTIRSELFEFGLKSGCAGLLGEADTPPSFILCSTIWLLVVLLSITSAYTSQKKRYGKLVTAGVLLFPSVIALLLLPFIGALAAMVELIILLRRRER